MPLTVGDALKELKVFAGAQVVAGRDGLQRVIRWAHIVDIPDVIPWVREGDLLLTTGFALKDNPEAQLELIPRLVSKELCGLAVELGHYLRQVPGPMIQLADELDFPIITLPIDTPFGEITRAIHERIVGEHYTLLQQSFHIHKVLTQLVLEGKDLGALVESLGQLLGCSVTIEDTALRLLAYTTTGPVDEVRKRSIAEGSSPRELVTHLQSSGLFERLRQDPTPQRVRPIPELGLTQERIIAPILVGAQLYGYVWIIASESPLTELDFMAIESAATVAALIMSRQQAVYEADQRLKASLLDNLLNADPYRGMQDLTETLRRLGLSQGFQVLAVAVPSLGSSNASRVHDFLEERIRAAGLRAFVVERGQHFITLLGTADPQRGKEIAQTLVEQGLTREIPLVIGLSTPSLQATQARKCYQEASEALRVGMALSGGEPRVWAFERLGLLPWLRALPPDAHSANCYHHIVEEMAEQDRERGSALLQTLEAYLDHLGNAHQTSRALYIHRNTLRQRITKIESTWGLDLEDPLTLLNLLIAIKDWRVNRSQ